MKVAKNICIGITLLAVSGTAFAFDERLISVETGREAEQKFVLTSPNQAPAASVVLFPGGHGKLSLSSFIGSVSFGWGRNNNLVRTRNFYAQHGFLTATVDAPSDRKKMNAAWRMGSKHAKDIAAVIIYLKKQADVPVWVIGTSMGSFSAANMGIRLKDNVAGVVLTSSITRSNKRWRVYDEYPRGVISMDLSAVTAPVLVVSHEDDQCQLTPASDIDDLANGFTKAQHVEKQLFSGGDPPMSDPCQALSQHGFLGIEQQVVDAIATFIMSN